MLCPVPRVEFIEAGQIVPRAADHGGGDARKLRHLQPVAAIGGTALRSVEEDYAIGMLDGIEVQIRTPVDSARSAVSSK